MRNVKVCVLLLVLCIGVSFISFAQRNCNDLPKKFKNYGNALQQVRNTKFVYSDKMNTSKSSFITGASYYSCDGKSGYMIVRLNNKDYIHQGLPKHIWLSFKRAESLGRFYSSNIRYKYQMKLE